MGCTLILKRSVLLPSFSPLYASSSHTLLSLFSVYTAINLHFSLISHHLTRRLSRPIESRIHRVRNSSSQAPWRSRDRHSTTGISPRIQELCPSNMQARISLGHHHDPNSAHTIIMDTINDVVPNFYNQAYANALARNLPTFTRNDLCTTKFIFNRTRAWE